MKPRYKCELEGFHCMNKHQFTAIVRRLSIHDRLGRPTGGLTTTSLIVRIDFERKEIETLNSIYCYGD